MATTGNLIAAEPLSMSDDGLRESMTRAVSHTLGVHPESATPREWYEALGMAVKQRLLERWLHTQRAYDEGPSRNARPPFSTAMRFCCRFADKPNTHLQMPKDLPSASPYTGKSSSTGRTVPPRLRSIATRVRSPILQS